MDLNQIAWPPKYQIKRHLRAKHVRMKINSENNLQITVPIRFNLNRIPSILDDNKDWIISKLNQIAKPKIINRPTQFSFHFINEIWSVLYLESKCKLKIIQRPHREIVLLGNVSDINTCISVLITWIKSYAKPYFIYKLNALSQELQLPYQKVTIRDQKTVWGSCTSQKAINLNYKLCFLPEHLVRYVMVHELCHTQHLDHSNRFWNLVNRYDPNWEMNRRELREANRYMPNWISSE